MPTKQALKKPAALDKSSDWDSWDVKAALEKAGWSLRQLGFYHGYTGDSSLSEVFRKPWPRAEKIIADAIGKKPQVIWPSRYGNDGKPNRLRGRAIKRPAHLAAKATSLSASGNPQKRKVA